jgi:uncharacterized protein DUF2690
VPRPSREVDPSAGPIPRFAYELRKLREQAGSPPYRLLAEQTHFSRATLAAAASGHRLPTIDVTLAYIEACGGDTEEWRARWHEVRQELGHATSDVEVQVDNVQPATLPDIPWRMVFLSGAALLVVTAIAAVILYKPSSPPPDTPTPATEESHSARFEPTDSLEAQPVEDGADPKRSQCASDPGVTTLDSIQINSADERFLGIAELRYAPRCNAAWGRFTPAEGSVRLPGSAITIVAQRAEDSPTSKSFEIAFDGQAVFGDIILLRNGCVSATVQVTTLSGNASSTTRCMKRP